MSAPAELADAAVPEGALRRRPPAARVLDRASRAAGEVHLRERVYRHWLVVADILAVFLAMSLAFDALGGVPLRALCLAVAPPVVLAAKIGGLYDHDELVLDHSTLAELPRLLNLATMIALLVWLLRGYVASGHPGTPDLLALWVLLAGGLVLGRSIARELARRAAPVERCLLVGRRNVFERLDRKFRRYPRVELVDVVDAAEVAGDQTKLCELAERDNIHRIIIDADASADVATVDAVRAANATGLHVSLVPSMLTAVGASVAFDDVGGMLLMGVPRFGLSRTSRALKRVFDLAGACVIVTLAAPVLIAIAIAIKLDSRGPVLFRQTRMGRDEVPFEMLKFRSMVAGADRMKDSLRARNEADGGLFKIDDDPRITRVGRFLRRTGLDELPQIFNVVTGAMSLVGPRPLVLDEDRHVTGYDRRRLHLTPGITGRWQTLGAARVPLAEMVKIDYLYIASWSPWLDLKIMVETIGYLARGRGQ